MSLLRRPFFQTERYRSTAQARARMREAQAAWRQYTHLPLRSLWHMLWEATPGRMNQTLGATAACLISVLVGETWQIPMTQLLPVMLLALWKEDWVTNCLLGLIMILYFTVVMAVIYLGVFWSINNYFLILFINLVFSYVFFFLENSSKLGVLAMLGGLFVTFFLSDLDTLPTSNLATRAILYCWLVFALIGVIQIGVSLVVSPSPEQVLCRRLAWRLELAARLLEAPEDFRARQNVLEQIQQGITPLLANVFLSAKEKVFPAPLLDRLRQAALHSFTVLVMVDLASCSPEAALPAERRAYAALLREMAVTCKNNALPELSFVPATSNPALQRLGAALLAFCSFSEAPLPVLPTPKGFFLPDAFSNPAHTIFSFKGTLTIFLGILCYRGLDWNGIHTCVITSFVGALPTMGEVIAKLNLRLIGATIGSLMGMGAIIWLLPHFISIAQLLLMFLGMTIIASWVQCGDPRISYAGMQIGIAIFLSTLATFTPATNLDVPRDRIIGTFLGLLISYVVFTCIYPTSAASKLPGLLRKVDDLLRLTEKGQTVMEKTFYGALTEEAIARTHRMLEYNLVEPLSYRLPAQRISQCKHRLEQASRAVELALLHAA
ncbi:FUSC family protein [Oecophyllibacter saccharovorans]|uniref:FUSC family protein n=1 Tax=Oecophyllibacter saccharovorans TaxID=2558360 RepID=UPI00116FE331|nr:FUSC family protein [Oecophyllibacter saccharovorans]TPW35070.1 hypothetical protein E3203_06225 [Oecophyllibacter saccharovorans]